MESYKEFLKSEVQEFRKAGHRFLEKEISKAEFKGISGGMGVYAQQDQKSFMIRLRTPSGLISKEHLNLILSYVHKYGLEKVHLTTRQQCSFMIWILTVYAILWKMGSIMICLQEEEAVIFRGMSPCLRLREWKKQRHLM